MKSCAKTYFYKTCQTVVGWLTVVDLTSIAIVSVLVGDGGRDGDQRQRQTDGQHRSHFSRNRSLCISFDRHLKGKCL